MKTLIVEDDFTSRVLLQTVLSSYGECHVASTGKEAVEAFRVARMNALPYDLICMDILMPEMNGQEAVRRVRDLEESLGISSSQGVRIFMVSALRSITEVMTSFNELCDAYLSKPLDLAQLVEQLKAFHLVE